MNAKTILTKKTLPVEADAVDLPAPARKPKAAPAAGLATKTVAKSAKVEAPAAPVKAINPQTAPVEKPAKQSKNKLVRDSFTMPESDYAQFAVLKKRCLQGGLHAKKSELLRAGLMVLSKMSDANLLKAMKQVEVLKTGRPTKQK